MRESAHREIGMSRHPKRALNGWSSCPLVRQRGVVKRGWRPQVLDGRSVGAARCPATRPSLQPRWLAHTASGAGTIRVRMDDPPSTKPFLKGFWGIPSKPMEPGEGVEPRVGS
jgi:hypothetical protein